jgi:hypothetical protein
MTGTSDHHDLDPQLAQAVEGLPDDLAGFAHVYERRIRPELRKHEAERIRAADTARKATWGGGAISLAGGLGGLFALGSPFLAFAGVLAGFGVIALGRWPLDKLEAQAKGLLVRPVAENFGLEYTDKPAGQADLTDYSQLGLVPRYDRSRFEDRLAGMRNGVDFEFFEAELKRRKTQTRNGRTSRRYVKVFAGQCLRFDFHKAFHGKTLVTRDAGFFNRFSGKTGMQRAMLEDPEFEKTFEVFTTDQVEARFILTPDMMERLMELERVFQGKGLRCAFSGEQMLVVVEGDNLFQPGSMFTPLEDPARLRRILDDFSVMFRLIDTAAEGRRRAQSPPP